MEQWLKNKWIVLLGFLVLSLAWYVPTYESGATVDFLSWITKYKTFGFAGVAGCFGYPGLHQAFHFINYLVFAIFDLNLMSWTIIFSLVHGLNAYILFSLSNRIYNKIRGKTDLRFGLAVALLFVISPYQLEALTWNACLHYLLITAYFLIGYHFFLDYLEERKWKSLLGVLVMHALALFTLELSFVFPVVYLISLVVFHVLSTTKVDSDFQIRWKDYVAIVGSTFALLGAYLILLKLTIGTWVGHYGAEHHLKMDIGEIGGTLAKYLVKYMGLVHFYPYKIMQSIYAFITTYAWGILVIGVLAFVLPFIRPRKISPKWWLVFLGIVVFLIAVLPVSNLYFYKDMMNENGRYGYMGSTFLYMAMVGILFMFNGMKRHILFALVLLFHFAFSKKMINTAVHSGNAYFSLIDNFYWKDAKEVVMFNIPDNYGGIYMFRDFTNKGLAFKESVDYFSDEPITADIINPAQFNMMHLDDNFGVNVIDSVTFQVMIGQGGTWFWRAGKGAANEETEDYTFENHGWYYMLKMKEYDPDRVYLKQVGIEWEEVKVPGK